MTGEIVERGKGVYGVTLRIEHLDAAGIAERLPPDAVLLERSLPPSGVKTDGGMLAMVAMNGSSVSYSFRYDRSTPLLGGMGGSDHRRQGDEIYTLEGCLCSAG